MDPRAVASRFAFPGRLLSLSPFGSGNVNDTYLAVCEGGRCFLQRINQRVFKKPAWIMENMRLVTEHVHKKAKGKAGAWRMPRLIQATDGKDFHVDPDGDWWRALTAVDQAKSYETAQSEQHAFEAGAVVGQFHRLLSDLDPGRLRDTLPGFHVTPLYLKGYDAAKPAKDAEAQRLAKFVEERRGLAQALEAAKLKPRLIHGDPKINNIMIDENTGKGVGIVDLDTVKPGLVHYDFGDALRSICNPAGEEAENLEEVRFDAGLCAAFSRGYLPKARDFLDEKDLKHLYEAVRLIAFELGLRFFTDHLNGDKYFKVRYSGHNLKRAQVQFKLVESIEAQEKAIRKALKP